MTLLRAAEAAVATVVVEDITAQACAAARCMRDAATPAEVTPDVSARPILSPAAQAMASQAVLATPGAIHIADMVRRPRSELRPWGPQPTAVTTTATTRTAIGSATANIRISAEASYLGQRQRRANRRLPSHLPLPRLRKHQPSCLTDARLSIGSILE